jgi:hypothetical protein
MSSLIQLNFFDKLEDPRPLPLLTAEKWNFPLAHVVTNDGNTYYACQDWYKGLSGDGTGWKKLKKQLVTSSYQLELVQLPYVASNGKTYQIDFTDDKGLYRIAQEMRSMAKRPQLDEIKQYLAESGAWVNNAIRNPDQAAHELNKVADRRYEKILKGQGFTDEQIPQLQADRREDVAVRLQFTDMLKDNIEGAPQYWLITNTEYKGLFHRDANTITQQTGGKNAREAMHPIAKNFCRIVELTMIEKVRQLGHKLTNHEADNIMRGIANSLGVSVDWIQKQLGMDIVTGKPLLTDGQ